ncbi:hypothetical protein D3C79_1034800 [compost metagenome]
MVVAGFLDGIQPVHAAIRTGNVAVEAGSDVIDEGRTHDGAPGVGGVSVYPPADSVAVSHVNRAFGRESG